MSMNNGKHLNYNDRLIIEKGIFNGLSRKEIARNLGKSISSIAYEINVHRFLSRKADDDVSCKHIRICKPGVCYLCEKYEKMICKRRDSSPGACNGCSMFRSCKIDRYRYEAKRAQNEYEYTLSDSRSGVNLSTKEAQNISDKVKPLLERGLSPYIIVKENRDLFICEKTLYNYINDDILPNIGNLDLHSKVRYRIQPSKRRRTLEDREYITNRTYDDYLSYIEANNVKDIVLMNTVEGNKGGKVITTFHFVRAHLMFGILQESKEAIHPLNTINELTRSLGLERYQYLFEVILTDRGSEFSKADEMENYKEKDETSKRGNIFYCDAMQSWQKAEIENAHRSIRVYLPKGSSFNHLNQSDLNKMFSHIANYPLESLNGKTPYDAYSFYFLESDLPSYGISKIDLNELIRKPSLLK